MRNTPWTIALLAAVVVTTSCGLSPLEAELLNASPSSGGSGPRALSIPDASASGSVVPGDGHVVTSMIFPFTDLAHGLPSDPVNVLVVGDRQELVQLLETAGWVVPDPIDAESIAHFMEALITWSTYAHAPLSTQTMFGRPQDIAFEKNCIHVTARDHFRGWASSMTDGRGRPVWCLACTRDAKIGLTERGHMPNHIIDPDVDKERDLVVGDLSASGQVASAYEVVGLGPGYRGHNAAGDPYFTDGMVKVLELR